MSTPWPTYKTIQLNRQLNKHLRYKYDTILIDAGICFTLAVRSATEAKIAAVPDSLQSPHCSSLKNDESNPISWLKSFTDTIYYRNFE